MRHAAPLPCDRRIEYRRELNDQQYAAVTAVGQGGSLNCGPMLVIAGAGSGKTRTLTYRVAWLVEHGVPPQRILLLTFTNKAAREMLRRVASLLPTDISSIWGGTFHHIGNRILRRHARLIGYAPDFSILDRADQKDLLDRCLVEARIDSHGERFPKGEVLAEIYSLALNTGRTLEQVLAEQYDYFAHLAGPIRELRARYDRQKHGANVMDYDDLLVKCLQLFRDHGDVGQRYREQFVHVLVDEYQDTNRIQADLIDSLAQHHRNLLVVGDDAQSIYSWRGADYRNILDFPKRYSGARIFKIEVNYRSVPAVLTLANEAIKGNVHQFAKTLRPVRQGGAKPWLVACADTNQQAQYVACRILELRGEGVALNDIAVLYRAHYHAMELQMELTRRRVPFVITSGLRFFEQAHIKDVAGFLRITVNPRDELSFLRIARLVGGVGMARAGQLWEQCQPLLVAGAKLAETSPAVPRKAAGDWRSFAATLNRLRALHAVGAATVRVEHGSDQRQPGEVQSRPGEPLLRRGAGVAEMIELVVNGFYEGYLKARYPNARSRLDDLTQLASFGQQFESADEFLSQLALLTNLDADDASLRSSGEQELVRLSTVHQAKGQEWEAVFVIGLCDGMFPLSRVLDSLAGEEEERRLFYVAVTRAKDELYLLYPRLRMTGGDAGGFQRVSRFVGELKKENYQELALCHQSRDWRS